MTPFIEFENVTKAFGSVRVVEGLNLGVARGEFVSLLGPSGSGKTTTLMMLAGFEAPTSGAIRVDGRQIDALPPHKRNMGVVFQNYALFPHMSVAANLAFPLLMRRVPKADVERRVRRALEMVQLGHLEDRKPAQLSGGQQQRVALARALVFEPGVVLMDEPLGALDKQLRGQMQLELRDLHRDLGLTVIFVTHDQTEALTMSDRIAVFNAGRIEQIDTPAQIYDQPSTRFVAEFIGETNLLEAEVVAVEPSGMRVAVDGATLDVAATPGCQRGDRVSISLRPEAIRIGAEGLANALPVIIKDRVYQGDHVRLHLECGALRLVGRTDRRGNEGAAGERATASFDARDCTVLTQ